MERKVFQTMAMLIIVTNVFAGCRLLEKTPTTQVDEEPTAQHPTEEITEADLVEDMAAARKTYLSSLKRLIEYYAETDKEVKLQWARKKLARLMTPAYPGPVPGLAHKQFKATDPIPAADALFSEAQAMKPPNGVPPEPNKDRLRLQKYDQLIRDYPTSDKIDDAAFQAGLILEEFREYRLAFEFYKDAFKFDAETFYPARFKAAYILDKHMDRHAEALQLYQEALKTEGVHGKHKVWKKFAEQRIREIQKLDKDGSM